MSARFALVLAALLSGCATAPAVPPLAGAATGQAAWAATCNDSDEWDKPGPPFRIYGNTYYVGTCGISAILIARGSDLTLIDSGTDKGAEIVLANIRALGFDPKAVDSILMSHEHFDHVGGMARLQAATGATIYTTAKAAEVLRSGEPSPDDPQAKSDHPAFQPVTGRIVAIDVPGARAMAGSFRPIYTPGHTLGALSWSWPEPERGVMKRIVYADSMNPISSDGYRFSDHPDLVAAFRRGIDAMEAADCDIVLAPHPVAVDLRKRLAGEKPLVDPAGCRSFAAIAAGRLDARLAKERDGG